MCLSSSGHYFFASWSYDMPNDWVALKNAVQTGNKWDVLYYAKRLMQVNPLDAHAVDALKSLHGTQLLYTDPKTNEQTVHPLLGGLDGTTLIDIIREGELIERSVATTLCEYDDPGDTLFLILKGGVRIRLGQQQLANVGVGQIVGELAFLLRRNRTAKMVTEKRTALLSLSSTRVRDDLQKRRYVGPHITRAMNDFAMPRIIDLVCHEAPYLVGKSNLGPLATTRNLVKDLSIGAVLLDFKWEQINDRVIARDDQRLQEPGLYILTGGKLINSACSHQVLDGQDYPLLYVSCEGDLIDRRRSFTLDSDGATILHIHKEILQKLGREVYKALIDECKKYLTSHYAYDVFISYNVKHDGETAQRLKAALQSEDLTVFMDVPKTKDFFLETIVPAILDSLLFLPILSAHTQDPSGWVQREINYRTSVFDKSNCGMIPIKLTGADVKQVDGHNVVNAMGREASAIQKIIDEVRAVKSGDSTPPFAKFDNYMSEL
jgi:hypothetical protein